MRTMQPAHDDSDGVEEQTPHYLRRVLRFDGALNVRDLGGVNTVAGKQVRFGLVYRSDDLADLSAVDLAELEQRSVRTIVDFRNSDEVEARPSRVPHGAGIVSAPFPPGERTAAEIMELLVGGELTPDDAHEILLGSYRHITETGGPVFATLIRSIIGQSPVLFHCAGGKDRTGVAAAVILSLLGVGRDQIVADYMLTNDRLVEQSSTFQLRLAEYPVESRDVLLALGLANPVYIECSLAIIDREFGGIDSYARDQMLLTPAEINALGQHLLQP